MRVNRIVAVFLGALLISNYSLAQTRRGGNQQSQGIYKSQINPNWFHDNSRFWYRNDLAGGANEFILVDAVAGSRQFAFDHQRLATALNLRPDRLPFESIEFI